MTKYDEEHTTFNLRVPKELKHKVIVLAKSQLRSVAEVRRTLLRRYVNGEYLALAGSENEDDERDEVKGLSTD